MLIDNAASDGKIARETLLLNAQNCWQPIFPENVQYLSQRGERHIGDSHKAITRLSSFQKNIKFSASQAIV